MTAMVDRLGVKLIERQIGGKNGGSALLIEDARVILKKVELPETGIRENVDEKFRSLFTGGSHV